jgi:hypothetical protein
MGGSFGSPATGDVSSMPVQAQLELAVLDQATRILADAKSLDDIKSIRDKAEAARTYIKAARLGLELQNRAAEVKLRAERKAGQFLKTLKLRGGDRKSKRQHATLKLAELGISRDQSKRWQHVASVTEEDFTQYLKEMGYQGREITSAGLLRVAKKGHSTPRTVTRYSSTSEPAQHRPETGAAPELLEELTNHCRLLGDVLRPVYEEGGLQLKRGEKRIVGRLIGEMTQIIAHLKKTWPDPIGKG